MKKTKIIAILAVIFAVFAMTFFALAENKNSGSLFLDSDQDGLTDQEEKMIGADPFSADTDGDGYSDGKEVESGYNPLKAAPGDKLVPSTQSAIPASNVQPSGTATNPTSDPASADQTLVNGQTDPLNAALLAQMGQTDLLGTDAATDLNYDPENPNLTNEMIGQLMQLTVDKAGSSESFSENPSFSSSDIEKLTTGALETVDVAKNLPEIKDSELKILPPIEGKKLEPEEIKEKQKEQIGKYLAQTAFVLASNSPFSVEGTDKLQSSLDTESTSFVTALALGDKSKINSYAQKAQAGIDQIKKVEVPYILKDIHKSTIQLAIYTLDLKDDISLNASEDPMKSLAAASSLQAVAESAMRVQEEFMQILNEYGIEFVNFP